jgi:hypothetical protein
MVRPSLYLRLSSASQASTKRRRASSRADREACAIASSAILILAFARVTSWARAAASMPGSLATPLATVTPHAPLWWQAGQELVDRGLVVGRCSSDRPFVLGR